MRLPTKTTFLALASGLAIGAIFFSVIASAWTGPTATAPGSNVAAPLNVSSVNQTKSGNIGVNGLAVFGNTLLGGSAGSNAYLNFGATAGSGGYGIRDNSGTLQFKNSGDVNWQSIQQTVAALVGAAGSWTSGTGGAIYYNGGNVGVGQAAPNAKFDVSNNGGSDGLTITQAVDNVEDIQAYIDSHYADRTTYAGGCCNTLALQPDVGNVGVGTRSPDQKLTVAGWVHSTAGGFQFPNGTTQTVKPYLAECSSQYCTPTCSLGGSVSGTVVAVQGACMGQNCNSSSCTCYGYYWFTFATCS